MSWGGGHWEAWGFYVALKGGLSFSDFPPWDQALRLQDPCGRSPQNKACAFTHRSVSMRMAPKKPHSACGGPASVKPAHVPPRDRPLLDVGGLVWNERVRECFLFHPHCLTINLPPGASSYLLNRRRWRRTRCYWRLRLSAFSWENVRNFWRKMAS